MSGAKNKRHAPDRERFDEWQEVESSSSTTRQGAFIEEIQPGDPDANDVGIQPTSKKSASKVPARGTKLTATQRKSLQRKNLNPHTGKPKESTASSVEVEDGDDDDELVNEEDELRAAAESESESEDEDEAWDRQKAQATARAAAATGGKAKSRCPSFRSILIALAVLCAILGLIWIRLLDSSLWHGVDADDITTLETPDGGADYYSVLNVDRTASLKEIKASYRKLVLVTHPDKNPDCTDCIGKFQRVQKAYDVLSSPEKRKMYDEMETTYDVIQSETIELTSDNFESLVLHTDAVWMIQIYTDYHKAAIRFAPAWEEAAQRYGELVSFGRLHAVREKALIQKYTATKFGMIPSLVVYANGQFSDARGFLGPSQGTLAKVSNFLTQQFPNTVESVGNTASAMRAFLQASGSSDEQATVLFVPDFVKNAAKARASPRVPPGASPRQRAQQQALGEQSINEPSLTYKAIARKFQYAVKFGQVEQIAEPKAWRQWTKDISAIFKLAAPTQLPAILYVEAGESSPKWLTGDLNKEKLLRHIDGMHRRMVPFLNSHSYSRHCADNASKQPTTCVIALACTPLKNGGDLEFNTFVSGAKAMQKQTAFSRARLQFAKADVAKQTDLAPICAALPEKARAASELNIVVLQKEEMYLYSASEYRANQQFDAWLQHILKRDAKAPTPLPAPYVPTVHIPSDVFALNAPAVGLIYVPLRYIYGTLILAGLVVGWPIISQHGQYLVVLVFALSMALPGYELVKSVYDKFMAA